MAKRKFKLFSVNTSELLAKTNEFDNILHSRGGEFISSEEFGARTQLVLSLSEIEVIKIGMIMPSFRELEGVMGQIESDAS